MIVVRDSVNVLFEIEVREQGEPLDVSGASTKQIILERPNSREKVALTASFTNTGTDGRIYARSTAGDLAEIGQWKCYAYVAKGSYIVYTPPSSFTVLDRKID